VGDEFVVNPHNMLYVSIQVDLATWQPRSERKDNPTDPPF